MSKVYSFRLDADNPREAKATEVINARVSQGFSLRNILTCALIDMANWKEQERSILIGEFRVALEQISSILEQINDKNHDYKDTKIKNPQFVALNKNFLNSVKIAARPGLNLNQDLDS